MTEQVDSTPARRGPLAGVMVVELAGIGPGPFAAMVLGDLGADVIRVDRPSPGAAALPGGATPLSRSRRSVVVDLKQPAGVEVVLRMVERADVLVEGYRPGVAERLGVGPDVCLARNPALVYGRITGWGQQGSAAGTAGHDIDYIALAGALHPIGEPGGAPVPPLNLVGDFGGGGMLLVVGVLAALVERIGSGRGQVVDAAMVDGAALLMTIVYELRAAGLWSLQRGENLLDGGAPYYGVYATADGRHLAIGALEPQFYARLIELLGIDVSDLPDRADRSSWPELRRRIAAAVRTRTRDEWAAALEQTDACAAPVLDLDEAPVHPRNRERNVFVDVGGRLQPGPAPRFGRTPPDTPSPPPRTGEHTDEVLARCGLGGEEIAALRDAGVIA